MPIDAGPPAGGERRVVRTADRGFTAAFELVMTPALFAFLGHLLDGWLGTGRIFTIVLASLVGVYVVWKVWYSYNAEMDQLEADIRRPRSKTSLVADEL